VRTFCGQGGSEFLWTSALFVAKTLDFSKFMMCPSDEGELSQYGHFANKEEG